MNRIVSKALIKYKALSEAAKAAIWYTICNILNKGIALLSTPIFTRLLTEEQYGTFAIFQSWYNIILIFTSLNIFLGGYTKGLLLYHDDQEKFTSSQLALTTLITGCFAILYFLNIDFWTTIFELPPILMVAMFAELTVMPALEFWAAKERFDFKYKKYVVVSLAMTSLSLGCGVIAVVLSDEGLNARVFSDVLSKVLFAGIIFVMLFVRGKKFFVKEYWIYSLKFNIPLLPHYLSNYVLNQSDRIMIGKMVGNDKAAYYSVAYTISTMMLLITSALNNSLTPYIYKKINSVEQQQQNKIITKEISSTTSPLFLLVAFMCIITMAFAPEVILVFAGKNYMESVYVIPPIAASVYFIFLYSMFSTIEYYYQKTGYIAIATTISAVINLFLNYIFINAYGYYAAGYTTLVCYVFLSIMHYIFYHKISKTEKILSGGCYNMKIIFLSSFIVLLIMFVMVAIYKCTLIRYGLIGISLIILILNRNTFLKIVKAFRIN